MFSFSGWVKKKGACFGIWNKRYLCLDQFKLTVYKDDTKETAEKEITLSPSTRFVVSADTFSVDSIVFSASSIDVNKWALAIRNSMEAPPSLTIDDFKLISVLGRGFYGKVMLAENKSHQLFAIKSIQKKKLVDTKKANTVLAERNIMMMAKHPFIVQLKFAFQSSSKFYLGLEYVQGGELFYSINQRGVFQIDDARLYIAEIALALKHLHSLGIVYRDLKPENILVGKDGHLKLTDFGLSKVLENKETSSFCGTLEYISPELVLKLPYEYGIDIWALGILLHEMLTETTPFFNRNRTKMFNDICHSPPKISKTIDPLTASFITYLLTKDPTKRPNIDQVLSHPFFSELDMEKVYRKEYQPSFIPNQDSGPVNFDPEFTNEIPVDSYAPPVAGDLIDMPNFSYVSSPSINL